MRGSAIYRIGYQRWSRNLAVALGNAPTTPDVVRALEERRADHLPWCASTWSGPCSSIGSGTPDLHVVDEPGPA